MSSIAQSVAFSNTNTTTPYLNFEAQGSLVKLAYADGLYRPTKSRATRGEVTEFSRRSRKRLLEKTARIDLASVTLKNPIIFVTLTYAKLYPTPEAAKTHLDTFLKRIRRFAPESSGIWRIELQKRGAPHFHLIFFNLPYLPKETLNQAWGEVVGMEFWDYSHEPRPPITRIEALKTPRQAFYYVSKYVAKVPDAPDADSGFNYVPYLTALSQMGHWWGVFNRQFLPLAELIALSIPINSEATENLMFQYKRLMAHKWVWAKRTGRFRGATIFVDDSKQWFDALLWCILEYGE
jgi:hypothetical protein